VIRVQNHWNTILFRHGARVVCSSHRAGDGSVELGVVLVEVRGHGGKTPGNQMLLDVFFISGFCLYVIFLFFLLAYIYIYICVCIISIFINNYIYNYKYIITIHILYYGSNSEIKITLVGVETYLRKPLDSTPEHNLVCGQ